MITIRVRGEASIGLDAIERDVQIDEASVPALLEAVGLDEKYWKLIQLVINGRMMSIDSVLHDGDHVILHQPVMGG